MALLASNYAIIPVEAGSDFSLDGVRSALKLIEHITKGSNTDLRLLKILINRVDLRTGISRNSVEEIRSTFGEDMVFDTTIPISSDIEKSIRDYTSVIRYAPRYSAAQRYRHLAQEIIDLTGLKATP